MGDWGSYRAYKRDKKHAKGWWGRMLQNRSAEELTREVQTHLENKLVDPSLQDWDITLEEHIASIPLPHEWVPVTREEAVEVVNGMKTNVAVGPDGICVDLLKKMLYMPAVGGQLIALINHVISTNQKPDDWRVSFLALLAKCPTPAGPADLRPICMSSSFNKLVNRIICERILPCLRRGSRTSTCGKGRQSADLIGCLSRIRDVAREWREPLLVIKLDIAGAFDRLKRPAVVELVKERIKGTELGIEARFLLGQLDVATLTGQVPGGDKVNIRTNTGIKQGAPESAELFGLVIGHIIDEVVVSPAWRQIGKPIADLDLEALYFQDDIFLIETSAGRVARKIHLLQEALQTAGLCLAMNKTKIVATPEYKGKMQVHIGGEEVPILKDQSLRALGVSFNMSAPVNKLMSSSGRARAAFHEHRQLLVAHGTWSGKLNLVSSLIMSTWRWCAGAIHWPQDCLAQANTLQCHILRTAFNLRRRKDEDWVNYNQRTLRLVRAYLVNNHIPRWSTVILGLQHALHGHWARRSESIGPLGFQIPNVTGRALQWRDLQWWRNEQGKTRTGKRHPAKFYAGNPERNLAETIGTNWIRIAADRHAWRQTLKKFLEKHDVRWCRGRQLSICH